MWSVYSSFKLVVVRGKHNTMLLIPLQICVLYLTLVAQPFWQQNKPYMFLYYYSYREHLAPLTRFSPAFPLDSYFHMHADTSFQVSKSIIWM